MNFILAAVVKENGIELMMTRMVHFPGRRNCEVQTIWNPERKGLSKELETNNQIPSLIRLETLKGK